MQLAVDSYTRALELNPDLDVALLNRGFAYKELGEYEKALKDFDVLLTKESLNDSDKGTVHTNRGSIRLEKEDYPEAIADFRSALELTDLEGDPYVFYDLGIAYLLAGEFISAQETFEESVPYLDEFLRYEFIEGLKEEYKIADQVLKNEINIIVQMLENADI